MERARSSAQLAYSTEERHALVEAFVAHRLGGDGDMCLDIAADDEMFAYALTEQHQHRGQALVSYLRSGLTAAETITRILAWRFGNLDTLSGVLDFASGYGRTTRFLVPGIPRERLAVGEISQRALEFQANRFAVRGLLSDRDPRRLELKERFAAVVVLSLFTHLPRAPFSAWLARLWQAIEPGGVLVFSANGQEALFPGSVMPDEGLLFQPLSENSSLEAESYGSTWVTDSFVRGVVADACPGASGCNRLARGLWHFQDLYVVTRGPSAGASEAPEIESSFDIALPPEGYLDTCILLGRTTLQVAGWAIDRQRPGQPVEIRVLLNGVEQAQTRADCERRDLEEPLGARHVYCGWVARIENERAFAAHDIVLVEARSASGRATVLHLSEVEGADLGRRVAGALEETHAQNREFRARNVELERRIADMERSRFWKLRNLWFRAQKALGIRRG